MKNKSTFKIIILACIIILPGICYLLLRTGTNHYLSLPVYGEKEPVEKTVDGKVIVDTIYHTIADFQLTNQDGNVFDSKILNDRIYVADFFFTSCKTICPKMSGQMARLQTKYANDSTIKYLSFTVDPSEDTAKVLKAYAQKYKADESTWTFLTGSKDKIYDLARNSFLVNAVKPNDGSEDFIHSETFVLIDCKKRIRGFYDGTSELEVNRLADEIKLLKLEQMRSESVRNF